MSCSLWRVRGDMIFHVGDFCSKVTSVFDGTASAYRCSSGFKKCPLISSFHRYTHSQTRLQRPARNGTSSTAQLVAVLRTTIYFSSLPNSQRRKGQNNADFSGSLTGWISGSSASWVVVSPGQRVGNTQSPSSSARKQSKFSKGFPSKV